MTDTKSLTETLKRECVVPGNNTQTGTNFCRWLLVNLYDLTDDEADDAQIGGKDDGGFDAYFERFGILTIVQAKYSHNDHWSQITRLREDAKRLEQNSLSEVERLQLIKLVERLNHLKHSDSPPIIRYVFATADYFTSSLKQKLPRDDRFVILDIDGIAEALQDKVSNVSPRWQNHKVELTLTTGFVASDSFVCCLPLTEIAKLAREAGDYLFASNVRNFLKASRINKKMAETIKNRPQQFWFFNNGITLVCSNYQVAEKKLSVTAPQVVNGCQTVSTIRNVAAQIGDSALESGSILVRVIRASTDLKQDITLFTNAQNAVRGKDLYSLEKEQKQVKRSLKDFGYIYEVQRGEAAGMRPQERNSYIGRASLRYLEPPKWNRQIPAIEAVQAMAASLRLRPDIAYADSEQLTPLGQFYDEMFPTDFTLDARLFLFPYLIVLYARKQLGYGRGGSSWRRSAHFLFASTFHLLLAMDTGLASEDEINSGKVEVTPDAYELRLSDEARGVSMLKLADQVLDRFFEDTKVEEILSSEFDGDVKNMMKRQLTVSKWYPILTKRARRELERS